MTTTPALGIPELAQSQANPDVTHNLALFIVEALSKGVITRTLNAPPGSPTRGDSYIVGDGSPLASGAWAGRDNCIAIYDGSDWLFAPGDDSSGTPITMGADQDGMMVWVQDEQTLRIWSGSPLTWAAFSSGVSDGDKGDITVSASGATWTVDANAISDGKLRDSAALSVVGRSANSVGDPADIVAGTEGYGLVRRGAALVFHRPVVPGHIYGLGIANNGTDATNDIDVSVGEAADSTNLVAILLSGALTKRLDANWAAGTNQGMRNSAAAITDTTYHIYLVAQAGGANPDIYAHTSTTVATVITALQAESGGSAYIYARRIASIIRASSTIIGFVQFDDLFMFKTPRLAYSATNPGVSEVVVNSGAPSGPRLHAILKMLVTDTDGAFIRGRLCATDLDDTNPTDGTLVNFQTAMITLTVSQSRSYFSVMTDTSGQVAYRLENSDASISVALTCEGWFDRRGRLSA